ncbi:MAG: hypothetical protein MJZ59_05450 [Paludibacteraceae bacterium]|nr:hypothetical protein [Paludibacteraceae bacterium]
MKKIFSLFAALTLSAGLWAETVPYIDATGASKTADATEITNASATLAAGWYVVKGTDVQTGTLTCQGAVHIILADNAKLTATGDDDDMTPGIQVSGEGNSLTIYAQSTGDQMGQLIAQGSESTAGIGGGAGGNGTNITINGGTVTANGGLFAAGIGGGDNGSCSDITINGGIVTANGGTCAAGIGGGYNSSCSDITINGGIVTANGGSDAAGIGGGKYRSGSNIFVATDLIVKADNNNPPTAVIENNGGDLASSLSGKQYATITITLPAAKTAAIAEINAAIEGVTDEAILAIATTAITNINNATTKEAVNTIKTQALADIAAAILAKYKADAIAEIQTAGQGIQNTEMNNWINGAITDINAAGTDTKEKVDNIKTQILSMIQLFQDGKAEGDAAGYQRAQDELPTEGTTGPAITITKGDKTVTFYNTDKVEYSIVDAD